MKIAHFADIHIKSLSRHQEYKDVFSEIFSTLKTQIKPDLNIIAGDIWHTKTQGLTAEAIQLLTWFFVEFTKTAPTIVMLGNHDLNLNGSRIDVISPIIQALKIGKSDGNVDMENLRIVLDCETIPVGNVDLCFYPLNKKEKWNEQKTNQLASNNGRPKVAVFHGSVVGCATDNDWIMDHGEVELDFFNGHDFALLGDIHKHQFLGYRCDKNNELKPWIGYSGSTIQQNYGESTEKGFLVWDIKDKKDWSVEFVKPKHTVMPFLTFQWLGALHLLLESFVGDQPPKGSRIRIVSEEYIPTQEKREIERTIKTLFGVSEVKIKDVAKTATHVIQTNTLELQKKSLRNDLDSLQKLYLEFLVLHDTKHNLTNAQIGVALSRIEKYLSELNSTFEEEVRDVIWSIEQFKFSNTFGYGENNEIDFTKYNGIVGIFGNNAVGKSCLLGSLMYNLYNTTDRGPIKGAFIINDNANQCETESTIKVGTEKYVVTRTTKRLGKERNTGKSITSLQLSKILENGSKKPIFSNENDDTRPDTDKVLRKKIGTADDVLTTAFSTQGATTKFINDGATKRKLFLNKSLDLEIFEKLQTIASNDMNETNIQLKGLSPKSKQELALIEKQIQTKQQQLENYQLEKEKLENELVELKAWLMNHEQDLLKKKQQETIEAKIEKMLAKKKELEKTISHNKNVIQTQQKELTQLKQYDLAIDFLEEQEKDLLTINNKITHLLGEKKAQESKLSSLKKSIAKLPLVPCGDKFPNCQFIKESFEHQTELNSGINQQKLEEILAQISSFQSKQQQLEQLDIKNKLKTIRTTLSNIHNLEFAIPMLETNLQKDIDSYNELLHELDAKHQELSASKYQQSNGDLKKGDLIQPTQRKLSELSQKISSINKDILIAEQDYKTSFEHNSRWEKLTEELKILNTIVSAFSKNGIPALVLKTQLPIINSEIDNFLSGIFNFRVSLDTTVITSNILDIFIEDSKGKRLVELGSGMQQFVASIAIRVALSNLSSLPKPDFFVIDEGFGVLDNNGLEKVVDLFAILRNYFKTVFVITHNTEVKQMVDKVIEIDNSSGASQLLL